MRRGLKRAALGCLIVLVAVLAIFPFTGLGRFAIAVWRQGLLQTSSEDRKYEATREGNLQAIYKAMMLFHDSEGQFPDAATWMDGIQNRIRAGDMKQSEAEKKLIRPDLEGKPGAYGYALNDAVAGKYKGDVKDPNTVLVFESSDSARNAHGVPNGKGRMAVTVDGKIVHL